MKKLLLLIFIPLLLNSAPYISLGAEVKYKNLKHFNYVNPNAPKGGTLKSYSIGSFSSLNPFVLLGDGAAGIYDIYDTLMAQSMDEPYSLYPLVASSIEVLKDNSGVIFTLDSRAKFSDGVAIKPSDVKFSFDTLKTKGTPVFKQYYSDIKEAIILDSSRIQFNFKTKQNRELPLILGQLVILPEHFYMRKNNKGEIYNSFGENPLEIPLGSGAYMVDSFEVGKKIIYKRNKNYWAKDLASRIGQFNFDTLIYEYYRDEAVALQAFLNNKYDWRIESAAKVWARGYVGKNIESKKIIKKEIAHGLPTGMQGFFLNTRKDLLKNKALRRALNLAFDFDWANLNLFFSQYERTTSYFNHSVFASFGLPNEQEKTMLKTCDVNNELDSRIYNEPYKLANFKDNRENLKLAKTILESAGFKNIKGVLFSPESKEVTLHILIDNPAFERLAIAYAMNLKKLGINLEIQKIDSAQFNNRVKNFDFEIIVGLIGQSLFPGNEQRYFFSSKSAKEKGSKNYSGIESKAIDCLINEVINAKNSQYQIQAVRALDRALLWGDYVVAHYFLPNFRVAFFNYIKMPKIAPLYDLSIHNWWYEAK